MPTSKFVFEIYRAGPAEPWGDMLDTQWREQENYTVYNTFSLSKNIQLPQSGKTIYLRISRIAPLGLIYTEWSDDNIQWNFHYGVFMEMSDIAAYGLAITNHYDNEQLAHAQISEVKLQPLAAVPPLVRRSFPGAFFEFGQPVTLELYNFNPEKRDVHIGETVPPDWTPGRLSHGGEIHGATLTWKLTAEPGTTPITYYLTPNKENIKSLSFQGKVNEIPILGESDVSVMQTEARGSVPLTRRFWEKSDGLEFIDNRLLFVNANGTVLTHKNARGEYARLGGYEIETIPPGDIAQFPIVSGAGEIWSVSSFLVVNSTTPISANRGLRQYKDGQWIAYAVPEIASTTYPVAVLPGATHHVLVQTVDRIWEFNSDTRQIQAMRSSTPNLIDGLPEERLINSQDADGSYWIAEAEGMVRMTLPASGNGPPDILWEKMPWDPALTIQAIRWPRGNQRLGILFNYGFPMNRKGLGTLGCLQNGRFLSLRQVHRDLGIRDEEGTLWMMSDITNSFTRIGREGNETPVGDDFFALQTTDIAADPRTGFWVATHRGIAKYSLPLWSSPPEIAGLNTPVESLYEDDQGNLWFSGRDRLLCRDPGNEWRIYHYPRNIRAYRFSSFLSIISDSRLMALRNAVSENMLTFLYFDLEGRKFIDYQDWSKGILLQILTAQSPKGLYRIYLVRPPHRIQIERDDGHELKTVAEVGINVTVDYHGVLFYRGLLWVEKNGDLWISLENELRFCHGSSHQSFENLKGCRALLDLGGGRKWCGKDELWEYDGDSWRLVRGGFGLIYQFLRSTDGSIWIASENGLWRYMDGIWLQFGIEEGLPSNTVLCVFEDHQKQIWAGTVQGVRMYHPERDRDPPRTLIRKEDNVTQIAAGTSPRIVYTGIDRWKYTETERLEYSTRLDEGGWSPFSAETIFSATGLTAGSHRVQARAMDRNGNIDPAPVRWDFTVLPPWYHEPFFWLSILTSSLLVLFFGGYAVHRHLNLGRLVAERTAVLSAANQELLEQRVRLRQMASELSVAEERERLRLAADLHDNISQSLSLSIMELSAISETPGHEDVRPQTLSIGRRLYQTLKATQNLTFDLCPPELYQIGLEAALQEMTRQIQRQYGIGMVFEDDRQEKPLSEDLRYFLYRASRELLINVTKHAKAAQARVTVQKENSHIRIVVSDNGKGITPSDAGKESQGGFGLFSIKERLSQIGGSLTIESEPGQGTTVSLIAPLKCIPEKKEDPHENSHSPGG